MSSETANIIGFIGMGLIVAAYAYITASREPNPFLLHGTNLAGAVLLGISLLVNTNLASLTLEFFWAGIAIIGLVRAELARRRRRTDGQQP